MLWTRPETCPRCGANNNLVISLFISSDTHYALCVLFLFFPLPLLPLFFFYFYHCSRSRWTRNKYLDIFRRNKMAQVNWEVVIDDKLKLMPALLAVLQRCFNVAHERRNRAGLTQSRFVSLSPVTLFAVSDNISSFVREI